MQKAVKDFADHYDLLDDILAAVAPPPLADTDVTVARVMARAQCGSVKAHTIIREAVAAGLMESIGKRRGPTGHSVAAWRIIAKGKTKDG